jgi:flavin-binding protein dodecin
MTSSRARPQAEKLEAARAVARAGKTVKGIKSIYIKDFQAKVEHNKIVMYRINANISFMLEWFDCATTNRITAPRVSRVIVCVGTGRPH